MKSKLVWIVMMLLALFAVGFGALAQETTTTGTTITLDELVGNRETYYGQQVQIEGVLEDFLNVHTIIVGEGVELDNARVLVINNSGQYFSADLIVGENVRVSGTIYAPLDETVDRSALEDGVEFQVDVTEAVGEVMDMTPEAGMEMTPEAGMSGSMDMEWEDTVSFFYNGRFPADYDGFIIMELSDIQGISTYDPDAE
jgi:hypothetical protein